MRLTRWRIRAVGLLLAVLVGLGAVGPRPAWADPSQHAQRHLRVATYNLYLGADLTPLFTVAVALVIVVEIGHVIWFRSQGLAFMTVPEPLPADYSNTKELGGLLYTEHVYAFEIAAVILLLAIVAAITLTMRRRPGLKVQDIALQVAVRREDRVRLVSMAPSKDR